MSDDGTPKRRRRRWLTGCLVILGAGLLMLAVAWLLLSALSDRGTEALRAKGYPTTLSELEESYAKPPHGENAADYYFEAGKLLERRTFPDYANLPVQGEADLPPLGTPMPDDMRAVVALFLDHEAAALELIDEGAGFERARYPANLAAGPGGLPFAHLTSIRNTVRAQVLRTLHHSGHEEQETLLKEFAKLVRVTSSLQDEPVLISHMVSIAMTRMTLNTSERILNENEFSRAQLLELDGSLAKLLDNDGLLRAWIGERCFSSSAMTVQFGVPIVSGFFRADLIGAMDEFIALAEDGLPERLDEYRAARHHQPSVLRPLSSQIWPSFSRSLQAFYETLASITDARTAVAIQIWRPESGELPENLEGFPEPIREAWPVDPFSGQPLIYKRLDKGFIIYSIGGDLVDGGGLPKEAEPNAHREKGIDDVIFRILR